MSVKTSVLPYITIDGPEGVGKSTLLRNIKFRLEEEGYPIVAVKEPGETSAGRRIRNIVINEHVPFEEALLLFYADRIITQICITENALSRNNIVISDRSVITSLVLQGFMNDRFNDVLDLHMGSKQFIWPSLSLIAQLPVDIAMHRLRSRSFDQELSVQDKEPLEYHVKVKEYFDNAKNWSPVPVEFLDMNNDLETVTKSAIEIIKDHFRIYFGPKLFYNSMFT